MRLSSGEGQPARTLACVPLLVASSVWAASPWSEGLDGIRTELAGGLEAYRSGDGDAADRHFADAYFVAYESSGLEIAVRQFISAKHNYQIERMFRDLRLLVHGAAQPAELEARIGELTAVLTKDVEALRDRRKEDFFGAEDAAGDEPEGQAMDAASWGAGSALAQSLLIIVREGFEAILLVGALVAYLHRTGRRREIRVIYLASAVAVAASLLTAYLFQQLLSGSAAGREALEGATMLLASAVLFYVSYWLISKAESRRWQTYLRGKAEEAVGGGRRAALGGVAFLAVYREGAETVLFYQALFAGMPGARRGIVGGFALGCVLLLLLFLVFRKAVQKLPVGPFFAATSGLLFYLAFVFAGKGVHELQEAGVVPETRLSFVPHIEFLGIYPALEGMLAQALFAVALALVALRWLRTSRGAAADQS